jgi:hypothetical protein
MPEHARAASEWLIGQDLASGRLVRVPPEWRYDRTSDVQIVMPNGRFVPAKTRAFVDRLVRELTPGPPEPVFGTLIPSAARLASWWMSVHYPARWPEKSKVRLRPGAALETRGVSVAVASE